MNISFALIVYVAVGVGLGLAGILMDWKKREGKKRSLSVPQERRSSAGANPTQSSGR